MLQWLKHLFSRVTGVSTPLGGISWTKEPPTQTVRTFSDLICVTSRRNKDFIEFLKSNDGRIVFLKTHIDACVATEENYQIIEELHVDIDRIIAGNLNGMPLPIPNDAGKLVSVTFYFSHGHQLHYSARGTGIVMSRIVGFFEISSTAHSGPSVRYHLREFDAPLDFRVNFANRAERQ